MRLQNKLQPGSGDAKVILVLSCDRRGVSQNDENLHVFSAACSECAGDFAKWLGDESTDRWKSYRIVRSLGSVDDGELERPLC